GDRVDSPLGGLDLHGSCPAARGTAWIMLRPEQVQLSADEGAGVAARVEHRSFRGDHTMLDLALGDARIGLRVSSLSAPALGATVFLSVRGACMAFTDS